MTVVSIHPGVTREQIQENTGWPVRYRRQGRRDAGADRRRNSRCCATCTPAPTRARHRREAALERRMSTMRDVFLCDAVRTPIGRYGGALAKVRTDDLAAVPIKALMTRNPNVDWAALDEVYSAAPTRPARTTATSRAWRCCSPACRTACRA